ncbi:MAG: sigma-54-dependent Fis family transcriptional regulator, partial [Calditrichaeota bacterium]
MCTILIVDDEKNILKVMKANLSHHGFQVLTAQSAEEAWTYFTRELHIDLIITDYRLKGTDGLTLLKKIRAVNPVIPILMITAYGNIEHAVEAMRAGATNYLTKPLDHDEVVMIIEHTLQRAQGEAETEPVDSWQQAARTAGIIARSEAMRRVMEMVRLVSQASSTVLISGESGTGKELIARAIHQFSPRREAPFIPLDCGAIPHELMENELFGHEKGAYTGAYQTSIGKLELAQEGTLFLDEIGELPKLLQVKLLRVLQERSFFRIGGNRPVSVKCRLIAATNKHLEQAVQQGTFREDLYYRLNVISIQLPPLRERPEDILPLAHHFLQKFARENQKSLHGFDRAVEELLLRYHWPGNVRELRNTVERAVVMSRYNTIVVDNLPANLQKLAEA